jgi:hypothetical protein
MNDENFDFIKLIINENIKNRFKVIKIDLK